MQPRLKEDPREWLKFTTVVAFAVAVAVTLLWRRHVLSGTMFATALGVDGLTVLACWLRPRWFRAFYRGGMTASFHLGQFMGRVLLGLIFLLIFTPLGLVLRLAGKDLLGVKRRPEATSYWRKARPGGRLDQQF